MPRIDIRGDWNLVQSNNAMVHLHIDEEVLPSGTVKLKGHASHGAVQSSDLQGGQQGDSAGSTMFLVINWKDGSVGEYHGTFREAIPGIGFRLTGTTFDQRHPTSQATWISENGFHFHP